ncbi:NUDIX hydrolase domain-like protein [Desarmillaria tabescens]|uniref:NUDIX hydrolase domain-like protein n=1 Tax=Armillaria tabescens TaxID=1929756 RepID=A0AA39MP67_ARMTA|nr:NUDIX hydrolase domain-like protein [Desarmillaria tabescens]KAK0441168.1 NUDIX hydrolase domain-like protein [Desarmillaria tabescens]
MSQTPRIISSTELPTSEAKWITLKKLTYQDATGKERPWECAQRTTRKSTGIDAVAIFALIRSKTNAFPLSTVIIEQYRPPVDAHVIELPAGLIDEGETPESAAIRELQEETGYKADKVIESSSVVVCDPGMTNANMKLVVLNVTLEDAIEHPEANLEAGEFIVKRVVELHKLNQELQDYATKGFVVDARLSHFAAGYAMAERIRAGEFN